MRMRYSGAVRAPELVDVAREGDGRRTSFLPERKKMAAEVKLQDGR